eukprot:3111807-Prorocentrum_lima.AAC.1
MAVLQQVDEAAECLTKEVGQLLLHEVKAGLQRKEELQHFRQEYREKVAALKIDKPGPKKKAKKDNKLPE